MTETIIKNPIKLVDVDDGVIYTFKNYDQLVAYWPYICHLGIGKCIKEPVFEDDIFYLRNKPTLYRYYFYVLIDSFGDFVNPDIVAADYRKRYAKPRTLWGYPNRRQPGSKRVNPNWYRRPKTTQEKRWAHAWDDEEFAPKTRARRNPKNLPEAWDDIHREREYNWKKFRKHQWKDK